MLARLTHPSARHAKGCTCCDSTKVIALADARLDPTGCGKYRRLLFSDMERRWRKSRARIRAAMQADIMQLAGKDVSKLENLSAGGRSSALLKHLRPVISEIMLADMGSYNAIIDACMLAGIKKAQAQLEADEYRGLYLQGARDTVRIQFQERMVHILSVMFEQMEKRTALMLTAKASEMRIRNVLIDRLEKIGVTRTRLLSDWVCTRSFLKGQLTIYLHKQVPSVGLIAERFVPNRMPIRDARRTGRSRLREMAEILTAGDDDVCLQCERLSEDGPYTLATAEKLLPAHPNCRCALVPAYDKRYAPIER